MDSTFQMFITEAITATADFTQTDLAGIQSYDVKGYQLLGGMFIFSWLDGGSLRKMVLTNTDGDKIKAGEY